MAVSGEIGWATGVATSLAIIMWTAIWFRSDRLSAKAYRIVRRGTLKTVVALTAGMGALVFALVYVTDVPFVGTGLGPVLVTASTMLAGILLFGFATLVTVACGYATRHADLPDPKESGLFRGFRRDNKIFRIWFCLMDGELAEGFRSYFASVPFLVGSAGLAAVNVRPGGFALFVAFITCVMWAIPAGSISWGKWAELGRLFHCPDNMDELLSRADEAAELRR